MSTPKIILEELQDQLQASTNLDSVQDSCILLGQRENIAQFPTVFIELVSIGEADIVYGRQRLTMVCRIFGISQTQDKDAQLTDLLDLENNIKKALSSDITLGGVAISLSVKETTYEIVDYPVRACGIRVEILFQQDSVTRS